MITSLDDFKKEKETIDKKIEQLRKLIVIPGKPTELDLPIQPPLKNASKGLVLTSVQFGLKENIKLVDKSDFINAVVQLRWIKNYFNKEIRKTVKGNKQAFKIFKCILKKLRIMIDFLDDLLSEYLLALYIPNLLFYGTNFPFYAPYPLWFYGLNLPFYTQYPF